eukprot:TRINITY_DN7851_c0_g1_i1.p1 TRINITY_DN7851_c0_g1~~TRINITY_DN7851_c0_g1_i1.p1  ORF type:complete len:197 (-),score=33.20 TRINITY_DN7851_c0_g1_i1:21-533(-)
MDKLNAYIIEKDEERKQRQLKQQERYKRPEPVEKSIQITSSWKDLVIGAPEQPKVQNLLSKDQKQLAGANVGETENEIFMETREQQRLARLKNREVEQEVTYEENFFKNIDGIKKITKCSFMRTESIDKILESHKEYSLPLLKKLISRSKQRINFSQKKQNDVKNAVAAQ